MKTTRLYPSFLLAATVAALLLLTAMAAPRAHAADEETTRSTIKFSDPARPGTLRVVIKTGDITITGTDAAEVSVDTDVQPEAAKPRRDGLRVISESATFSLTEKDNVVTLDAGNDTWFGNSDASFGIEVPHNTNVVVSNGFGGEVKIGDLTGDIEVKSLNGEITLNDVAGSALVETINGEISANVTVLHEGKPLSFTSMNGEINIHVPADAKANVRLRTQNGAILTDFDDKVLVTKTENLRGGSTHRITVNAVDNAEIREAVREAVRAGVEAAREAAQAVREAAQAAREAAAEAQANGGGPVPPAPPMPPVPAMTGGKLVSGTLNGGGGPEIYAAAMNGDVTLRKAE